MLGGVRADEGRGAVARGQRKAVSTPGPRAPRPTQRSHSTAAQRDGGRATVEARAAPTGSAAPPALPAALGSSEDPLENRRRRGPGGAGEGAARDTGGCWLRGPARGSGRGTDSGREDLGAARVPGAVRGAGLDGAPGLREVLRPTPDGGIEQGDSVCRVLRP